MPSHAHEGGGRSTVGILGTATALLTLVLMSPASPASSATATAGAWEFYPGQATHVTTTTTDTASRTVVRAPINADGSSNWPAKRGVIPVQFELQAASGTTTTTTTTYDPPVWQSIGTDSESTNDVTFALFTPSAPMTVSDVTNLSADYAYTTGDCFGGSLRWTINTDQGNVYVYYGTPNGPDQGCSGTSSGSGQILITTDMTADRFEVEGAGAPVCTDYASAMTLAGAWTVNWVQLVVDSAWKADQRLDVSQRDRQRQHLGPQDPRRQQQHGRGGVRQDLWAARCSAEVGQERQLAHGAVNEAESIQPKDTGLYYRQVDCKYIYNLDVSSLKGPGTYRMYANIGGITLSAPAVFDLR